MITEIIPKFIIFGVLSGLTYLSTKIHGSLESKEKFQFEKMRIALKGKKDESN